MTSHAINVFFCLKIISSLQILQVTPNITYYLKKLETEKRSIFKKMSCYQYHYHIRKVRSLDICDRRVLLQNLVLLKTCLYLTENLWYSTWMATSKVENSPHYQICGIILRQQYVEVFLGFFYSYQYIISGLQFFCKWRSLGKMTLDMCTMYRVCSLAVNLFYNSTGTLTVCFCSYEYCRPHAGPEICCWVIMILK